MHKNWNLEDFDYTLPAELIAQHPLTERSSGRLMCLNRQSNQIKHNYFNELPGILRENDLLVFNDTKVIPARFWGRKISGGRVECLVERLLSGDRLLAHIRVSKAVKVGQEIIVDEQFTLTVLSCRNDLFELRLNGHGSIFNLLDRFGTVPLPPYIARAPCSEDQQRYQTIFARNPGAIAAPTAALHFDKKIMKALKEKKVSFAMLTLHVGAGTFQTVRTQKISDHRLHSEYLEVSRELCEAVDACHQSGGRVVAVGTTVVRALETASKMGTLLPFSGETRLFIYPGFRFRCVDALLTNFHTPKSSLLMLVCAFAAHEFVMRGYREAVRQKYRFFSYGDAMFIEE